MARAASLLIGFLAISIGLILYSVPPNTYSFARFILGQYFQNNQSRGHLDNREEALLAYVKSNASQNDPQSVLAAIDEFGSSNTWLMNVGNVKAKFLGQEIAKHQPKTFLELGCYVGYSAVTIVSQLPAGGKLISVDISPENVKVAEEVVAHAGLGDRVEFVVGVLGNVTKALKERTPTFDMVFIDHHKAVYLSDLKILIDQKFLKKGSVVIADNVGFPGAPEYLAYVEKSDAFVTTRHETQVEYLPFLKDLVTVSIYQ